MNRKRGATIKVPFFPDPAERNDAHIKLFVQRASPSSWPGRGLRPKSSRMARAEAALHPFFANKKEGAGLAAPGERLVESVLAGTEFGKHWSFGRKQSRGKQLLLRWYRSSRRLLLWAASACSPFD